MTIYSSEACKWNRRNSAKLHPNCTSSGKLVYKQQICCWVHHPFKIFILCKLYIQSVKKVEEGKDRVYRLTISDGAYSFTGRFTQCYQFLFFGTNVINIYCTLMVLPCSCEASQSSEALHWDGANSGTNSG